MFSQNWAWYFLCTDCHAPSEFQSLVCHYFGRFNMNTLYLCRLSSNKRFQTLSFNLIQVRMWSTWYDLHEWKGRQWDALWQQKPGNISKRSAASWCKHVSSCSEWLILLSKCGWKCRIWYLFLISFAESPLLFFTFQLALVRLCRLSEFTP